MDYYLERVLGRRCVYSEPFTMQIANLILLYMSSRDISIQEFAQEVCLPVEIIEEIFDGSFFLERSERERKAVILMLSNILIDPRTREKFVDAEDLARYVGLTEKENGPTREGQSHHN